MDVSESDMKYCPDIGSIFPISTLDTPKASTAELPFDHEPNVRYFSLCREALSAIGRKLGKKCCTVLMPAYTCQTVISPFEELGYECRFFGITSRLRIDVSSLRNVFNEFEPDILIIHPYYGRDLDAAELSILHELKNEGCVFIEDLTQCIFSTQRDDVFDYYVGSLRKWFPIPDGAVAFSRRFSLDFDDNELTENDSFVEQEKDAMFLRGIYYASADARIKEISRRIDKRAVTQISKRVFPHCISGYSHAVLSSYDVNESVTKRLSNYRFLFENVNVPEIMIFDVREVTSAPLYFPVCLRNREAMIQKLISHRIYAPILWPVQTEKLLVNEEIKNIYNQILAIPCDQRYDCTDLQRIIEVFNS